MIHLAVVGCGAFSVVVWIAYLLIKKNAKLEDRAENNYKEEKNRDEIFKINANTRLDSIDKLSDELREKNNLRS